VDFEKLGAKLNFFMVLENNLTKWQLSEILTTAPILGILPKKKV